MTQEQEQHTRDRIKQAEEALKQKYWDQISPRCRDLRLYIDRKEPNIDQALRLVREIEEVCGMWLD